MNHKKTNGVLDWWCDRAWIKFGSLITLVMTAIILLHWERWTAELKVIAAMAALIPVHVLEEWVFPGGFHYQYNTVLYRSGQPDRYPMCRLSDMITNLLATFLYVGLTVYSAVTGRVSTGVIMGTICFCGLEFVMHTVFGAMMYRLFRGKGKTTIYGPGSITAYLGFGVFGVILLYCMEDRTISGPDIAVCVGVLAFIAVLCILIPENLIKNQKSKYYFKSNGYFDRFVD